MAIKSIGYRLQSEGKAELKNDFAEVKSAGVGSMEAIAAAADKTADQAGAAADRATDRQLAAWRKQAAAAKLSSISGANQGAVNDILGSRGSAGQFATVNLDRSSGQARQSAEAFKAFFKAEDDAAASALKLKVALDPLWAAQQRYDEEIRSHNSLLAQGAIDEGLHGAAVADSGRRLREAENALRGHSNALGLNRMQFIVGSAAARNFVDSILAGASPMRAFMQQAGDVVTVLQEDDNGLAGGLAKVRSLLSPTNLLIGASTAALAIGATAWLDYTNSVQRLVSLSEGAGRVIGVTGDALEHNAEAAAAASGLTISAARDIETGFVKMGGIGGNVLAGLTALTKDFAAATGQDAAGATQQLGQAFQDPVKGAEDLAIRYGVVTQAQIDHIQQLVEQNDLYGAQAALLADLQPQFDGAAEHANILARAWRAVAAGASDAWTAMGKAIDRALGGGTAAERIAGLQSDRAALLRASGGFADTSGYDARIAALQQEVLAEKNRANAAGAVSRGAAAMKIVDDATGDDALGTLRGKLAAINGVLADSKNAAGLTADQLARARTAQDEYTHAVQTYLPEGEKAQKLAALDAQIVAAKSPAAKADLAAQRARIENAGKLITSAQAEAEATAKGAQARDTAARSGEGHAATLAREAAAMEVSARAALDVADAYLKTSAAGFQAEARRKALTDATRRGVDVDAQVRRQLDLQAAEGAAAGAKAIAGLRDETAVRKSVNDNVAAGSIAVAQMNQALSDEAAIRPLVLLRSVAQGEAYDRLAKLIDTYRAALASAHAEEAHSQALASIDALERRVEDAQLAGKYAGDTTGAYERARAAIAAAREAADRKYNPADAADLADKAKAAANADLTAARAKSAADAVRSERDRLAIAQAEIGLVGKSADEHDRVISRLQLQMQLAQSLGDQYSEFAPAILAARDAADEADHRLKILTDTMSELRSFGESFVDNVLSPAAWSDWGNLGKTIIRELESEFLKLALLNPIKNLISGGGLPTLSSLGSLFGGTGRSVPANYGDVTFTAAGSEYFSGGMTYVAENGPELINLPRGARVTPASETRRMMAAANDRGGRLQLEVSPSDYFDVRVREVSTPVAAAIGQQAVVGGAGLAARQRARAARQQLGRG